jgi:type II secretory pathway pseudopilin PulG
MRTVYGKTAVNAIEVILALLILGLVALLAVPRLSPAAPPPDEGALLRERLRLLRVAIERYYQDHGAHPGQHGDGRNPARSEAAFVSQLTQFSDEVGRVAISGDAVHCFGPYLRDGIPACPIAPRLGLCGVHVIGGAGAPAFTEEAAHAGWVYNCDTGQIAPNSHATDQAGKSLSQY